MAGLPHALDEALLSDLECPHCLEYMVPPIKLCYYGHHACSKCTEKVKDCNKCEGSFSRPACWPLESIIRRQKYPCAYRERGCLDLFSIQHIADHQAVCTYGEIICPVNKVNMECPWKGFKSQLGDHAKAVHGIDLINKSTLRSVALKNYTALLFCFGEVFLYSQQARDGSLYCVVQLIGPSSKASKYQCEFELLASNYIERISKKFTLRSYFEDFETSFSFGKGFRLDDVEVRNFVVDDRAYLNTTLSKV